MARNSKRSVEFRRANSLRPRISIPAGSHPTEVGWADGGLIGGAALKAPDFLQIINAANQE